MSSMPVSDLLHLVSPHDELEFAEYCFKICIDFAKKPKANPAVYDLKRIVTALLNTSGGLVYISSYCSQHVDDGKIDNWMRDLEGQLTVFISKDIYRSCIKIVGETLPLVLKVTRSPKLITLNSHLFVRQIAGNNILYDSEDICNLINAKSTSTSEYPLGELNSLEYGSEIQLRESQTLEFKHWSNAKNMFGYKSRLHMERIGHSLFSLPNLSSGGDLIIGVEENKTNNMNTIYGQVIREQDEALLTEFLKEFFRHNNRSAPRIWGEEGQVPEIRRHWNIEFIPVTNCPSNERRRLIRIHFYHCRGGVFELAPESYMVSEDGSVTQMPFEQWKRRVLQAGLHVEGWRHILGERRERAYSGSFTASVSPDGTSGFFSWTKNRKNPEEHQLLTSSVKHQMNVAFFTEEHSILKPENQLRYTPSKETILRSQVHPDELEQALTDIENICSNNPGFAIASSRWTSNMQHEIEVDRPAHHVMDLFVMDNKCKTYIWAIVDESCPEDEEKKSWIYSLISGRLTKRNLLLCDEHMPYHKSMNDFQIHCGVYKLKAGVRLQTSVDMEAPSDMFLSLRDKLGSVLLGKKTYIKTALGQENGIFLTAQQMENVLVSDFDRFNFVEGPPGSGKTYLALHLCTKFDRNKVGYVCTTVCFEAFLLFQGTCHAILVQNEEDLLRHLRSGRFAHFECLIIDDIHNITCSEETWKSLFQHVRNHSNLQLFIFADSRYQSFKTAASMSTLKLNLQRFCESINIPYHVKTLSVVHRNMKTIVSFIRSCFEEEAEFPEGRRIACSHTDDGDVEIRKVRDVFSEESDSSFVQYIRSLINPQNVINGEALSYQATDIAILVDTAAADEDAARLKRILTNYLEGVKVHGAGTFPVRGLTVDTLDNFLGLDRELCIFVCSREILTQTSSTGRSMRNPLYKAFVASRGVAKVVFIVNKLDVSIAKTMRLNKVFYKAARLGSMHTEEEIVSVAFVISNTKPSILYITNEYGSNGESTSTVHLVSIGLEHKGISMDIRTIRAPVFLESSKNHEMFCLVYKENVGLERYYWSVFKVHNQQRQNTQIVDGKPVAVCWTPEHDIVMSIVKNEKYCLRKYTMDGALIWERNDQTLKQMKPTSMITSSIGQLFVIDDERTIQVLTPDGDHTMTLNPPAAVEDFKDLKSLMLDATDEWLMLTHENARANRRIVSVVSADGKHVRGLLQPANETCMITDIFRDLYIVVATNQGLVVYDGEGFY